MTILVIMQTVPVAKLKATLSEFLAKVKAGEEVIVTERGKPIAKIVPLSQDDSRLSPHLRELERLGLARIGFGRLPRGVWALPRPQDEHGAAVRALKDERTEDR